MITQHSLLPAHPRDEIIVARVIGVFNDWVECSASPGASVRLQTDQTYQPGQMVVLAAPGGQLASAHIIGLATGQAGKLRHWSIYDPNPNITGWYG